jgi:hypothetical protein
MSVGAVGDRPGGLTALAVVNFILGGYAGLQSIAQLAQLSQAREGLRRLNLPEAFIFIAIVLHLCGAALAIASGIGYIKQRRFLGRGLGNLYGVVGIIDTGSLVWLWDFNLIMIVLLVYPVMTLVLLNTTFRDDFAVA